MFFIEICVNVRASNSRQRDKMIDSIWFDWSGMSIYTVSGEKLKTQTEKASQSSNNCFVVSTVCAFIYKFVLVLEYNNKVLK